MAENREHEMEDEVIDVTGEPVEDELRHEEPVRERPVETTTAATTGMDEMEPLFETSDAKRFRTQWLSIQSKFVDDPRESVKQADELVASVLKSVTMGFSDRRVALEQQWNSGEDISTEDLRVALKRYRSFFDRLLTLES
ncbi:MAG TPA: hypothetical protein VK900_05560 [Anaerolineales bacterium]|nr:hypothetical protein [Anaerolineales bacterium]